MFISQRTNPAQQPETFPSHQICMLKAGKSKKQKRKEKKVKPNEEDLWKRSSTNTAMLVQMELNRGKAGINVWAEPHTSSQSPKHRNELERHTEVLQTCRGSSESLLKQRIAAAGERDITPEHGTNFTTVCASCLSTFTLVHPLMDLSPMWCHKGQWPHPNSLGPGVACLFVVCLFPCFTIVWKIQKAISFAEAGSKQRAKGGHWNPGWSSSVEGKTQVFNF